MADTHGVAADFSIHQPGRDGDERNYHCHLMTTTRRLTPDGLSEKTREWDDLKTGPALSKQLRAFVAQTLNHQLAAENLQTAVLVEHRSFAERGTPQKATRHMGVVETNVARRKKGLARASWEKATRTAQAARHLTERMALKTRQDFALSAKDGALTNRQKQVIRRKMSCSLLGG